MKNTKNKLGDYVSRYKAFAKLFFKKLILQITHRKIKVYFACAIAGADEAYLKQIKEIKDSLRINPYIELLDFYVSSETPNEQIYKHDIFNCVHRADIIFADYYHPYSDGRGYEICVANEKRQIPVVVCVPEDKKISRLISGAECFRNPLFKVRKYTTYHDFYFILNTVLQEYFPGYNTYINV